MTSEISLLRNQHTALHTFRDMAPSLIPYAYVMWIISWWHRFQINFKQQIKCRVAAFPTFIEPQKLVLFSLYFQRSIAVIILEMKQFDDFVCDGVLFMVCMDVVGGGGFVRLCVVHAEEYLVENMWLLYSFWHGFHPQLHSHSVCCWKLWTHIRENLTYSIMLGCCLPPMSCLLY